MAQAVIAVRGGAEAKSRCGGLLSPADRETLTSIMLEDMLTAIARCEEVSETWVVTPTPRLARLAASHGARVVRQDEPAGLNAAFEMAAAAVRDRAPYDAMMLMPGDLPGLDANDLAAAALLARTHALVLAPTHDGGTGLLGLSAGVTMTPEFGPDSFERHAALAAGRRHSLAILTATSLGQDVDRPDDLLRLLVQHPDARTSAFLRDRLQTRVTP